MTRQENPNFVASKYAPNPKEVSYWIDLSSDTTGNVIKSFDGKQWIPTNYKENTDQSERIDELDASLAEVDTRLNAKANSADVYTKSQTDTAISNATNNKVTSTSVNSIQIVDAIPEADSQVSG